MNITVRPEIEALIQQDVARGLYRSVEEYVEEAVQRLHEEERLLADEREQINDKIERALTQFEQGDFLTAEESKAHLQQQKAAWRAGHRQA